MDKPICQSCGMPMSPEEFGTNKDGSPSSEYCKYCYQDGAFTKEETLDEMIETCIPFMLQENPEVTEAQVREHLQGTLGTLKRWA